MSASATGSTIGKLIQHAAGILRASGSETPRLDAELLLGHVLGVGRSLLLAEPELQVSEPQQRALAGLIERRASGEPVAYIRGLKEFYGLVLSVDRRSLIPRPETELLVDLGLARIAFALTDRPRSATDGPLLVWDVGTGSGAVAVALAVECRRRRYKPDVHLRATDISADAISLATENAVAHGMADSIDLAIADLTALPSVRPADLLLANLPYVPSAVVPVLPVAASFEPVAALDGGPDGLAVIRRLLGELPAALATGGRALLEIGSDQSDAVAAAVAAQLPAWKLSVHDDLDGRPRVAEIEPPADA